MTVAVGDRVQAIHSTCNASGKGVCVVRDVYGEQTWLQPEYPSTEPSFWCTEPKLHLLTILVPEYEEIEKWLWCGPCGKPILAAELEERGLHFGSRQTVEPLYRKAPPPHVHEFVCACGTKHDDD